MPYGASDPFFVAGAEKVRRENIGRIQKKIVILNEEIVVSDGVNNRKGS